MRDFLEYVERSKEDSPAVVDFYMEGFLSDVSKMEGMDPVKTFILGFLTGKGIDIKANREHIMKLLSDKEVMSATQAVSSIKNLENMDVKELRGSLNSTLASLRSILKEHKTPEQKMD